MPRKLLTTPEEDIKRVTQAFADSRDPENDWQRLMRAIIKNLMDDFIRLQHPSARDEAGCKEAFQNSLAALYDNDYKIEWPGEDGKLFLMSFRELLAHRFGLDNINRHEIQKLPLEPLRKELIAEAKAYWLDRKHQVVKPTDFICYRGEAYSLWPVPVDEDSEIDHDDHIIYVRKWSDMKRLSKEVIKQTFYLIDYKDGIDLTHDQIEQLTDAWWEVLRMNNCFRGEK